MRMLIPLLMAACALPAAAPARACPIEIIVPAYQYPLLGTEWATLAQPSPGSSARVIVILNPASGPGLLPDPVYIAAASAVRLAGRHVLAYVDTAYMQRPAADVLADVSTYLSFYPIDGVFLDQMSSTPTALGYYGSLTAVIRTLLAGAGVVDGRVIGNAGTSVPESFVAMETNLAADVIVTYENDLLSQSEPYFSAQPPAWTAAYPAGRFSNIVYNVPDAPTMLAALGVACQRHVGQVFFTDGQGANPYDHLPPYWPALLRAVGCVADFNCSQSVTVQDIFDFLRAYFVADPLADVNRDNTVSVQDIFDFLVVYFSGCG